MGLETIALVALAVGTAASAGGAIYSATSAQAAGKRSAQIAQRNALVATQAAEAEAADARRRARKLLGAQIARTGASGVELEGSPLMVMLDSAAESELDAQRILYAGKLQALGYGEQAQTARDTAASMATSAYIQGGTTLLTNVSGYAERRAERDAWAGRAGTSMLGGR